MLRNTALGAALPGLLRSPGQLQPQNSLFYPMNLNLSRWQKISGVSLQGGDAAGALRDTALGAALPGLLRAPPGQLRPRPRAASSGAADSEAAAPPRRLSASLDEGLGARCFSGCLGFEL